MPTGTIFDIKKFSIHDGPGIRTTVFLKGCSMRCRWCHNPESQEPKPELMFRPLLCIRCGACLTACAHRAVSRRGKTIVYHRENCANCGACVETCHAAAREMVGRKVTVEQVMAEVEKDRPFYEESGGGVTLSGGEPLAQGGFLIALTQACREKGLHVAVDTCGLAPWEVFEDVRKHVDLFLYDLKLMDDARHREFTGESNKLILKNLRILSEKGQEIIIRVPIVPDVTDHAENIRQIGGFAAALPTLRRVELLPYYHIATEKYKRLHRRYQLSETRPPGEHKMADVASVLREYDLDVKIGG